MPAPKALQTPLAGPQGDLSNRDASQKHTPACRVAGSCFDAPAQIPVLPHNGKLESPRTKMLEHPLRVVSRCSLTDQADILRPVALQNVLTGVSVIEIDPRDDAPVYRGGKGADALDQGSDLGSDPFLELGRGDARGGLD